MERFSCAATLVLVATLVNVSAARADVSGETTHASPKSEITVENDGGGRGLLEQAPPPAPPPASPARMPWMILLCTPSDQLAAPANPSYYRALFTQTSSSNPTLADYWSQISSSAMTMTSSSVSTRWFAVSKTLAQLTQEPRAQKLQDCIDAAGKEVSPLQCSMA
jgi:hypothetical protein